MNNAANVFTGWEKFQVEVRNYFLNYLIKYFINSSKLCNNLKTGILEVQ